MKKYSIFTLAIGLIASASLTSCGDASEEITSIPFGRILSPVNLTINNIGETNADIKWALSDGATSYNMQIFADDSLSYEMAGTPAKTISGITAEDLPITVDGLFFDTKYTVYIQSVNEDGVKDSKWNGAYFRTNTKQFLKNPKPVEIADRSVTLTWEVEDGYDVSTIVIGNITHTITPEEKEAGQAIIEGLTPETEYTAYMYYNGKQCGNRKFTTIADLEGAILVYPDDNLWKILEGTEEEPVVDGSVFALYGGSYDLNVNDNGETGAAKINKSITIKGIYPTDQPVINGRFELNDGASLTISQVVIDGSKNSTTDQIFNYKTAGADYGVLDIQNSTITGRADGKGLIYLNVKATVEAINITNSIIYGIECNGGDFIDSRAGLPKAITLSKSTFSNVAKGRDFIRVDDKSGDFAGQNGPVVTVDQCTLYNIGGNASNNRIFYVRFAGNDVTFTNNVVVGTKYKRGFANGTAIDLEPTLQNNYYYDCENLTSAGGSADATISWFDTEGTIDNPGFTNADKLDFTLNPNSAAYKGNAGDPRWIVAQ